MSEAGKNWAGSDWKQVAMACCKAKEDGRGREGVEVGVQGGRRIRRRVSHGLESCITERVDPMMGRRCRKKVKRVWKRDRPRLGRP